MNCFSPRHWALFFDLFESLPRQGPGNRESAARALAMCGELPPAPRILDLGCGVGGQTLHLSAMTSGLITAVDSHAPSLKRLRAVVESRGLEDRIKVMEADMSSLDLPPWSFDLVWSEGALYNIGIENALNLCRRLLRPGGALAFTDAVWLTDNPPKKIRDSFEADYPEMGRAADLLAAIVRCGFEVLGHFTLPDEAWWDDFYTPMEEKIGEMRRKYAGDEEALSVLSDLAREPEMHRLYSSCYAYEFFVARKAEGAEGGSTA
ncbi:MAG: class I SAM-dependent methyltransferase [Synergistaceae bacterium]|nr:class I SAM-dependent methyltransferase [Synergistota bacterium]NLM71281.1 class I SAM-dependent methyltransferase [Synergistaceae bacterium]